MEARNTRQVIIAAGAAAALALYAAVCFLTGAMPRCPFKWATGLDCPGCGSQRALRALLGGHPLEAWSYNLLLPMLLAYILLIILLPLCRGKRAAGIHRALTSPGAVYGLLGAVILWWVLRNILNI